MRPATRRSVGMWQGDALALDPDFAKYRNFDLLNGALHATLKDQLPNGGSVTGRSGHNVMAVGNLKPGRVVRGRKKL